MSIIEQLAALASQFPHSKELAVSPEMLDAFELWGIQAVHPRTLPPLPEGDGACFGVYRGLKGESIRAYQTPFYFRDRQLTVVMVD